MMLDQKPEKAAPPEADTEADLTYSPEGSKLNRCSLIHGTFFYTFIYTMYKTQDACQVIQSLKAEVHFYSI